MFLFLKYIKHKIVKLFNNYHFKNVTQNNVCLTFFFIQIKHPSIPITEIPRQTFAADISLPGSFIWIDITCSNICLVFFI